MRSLILSVTMLSLLAPRANADVLDLFEDLQPVSTLFTSNSSTELDFGGDTCCTGSTCCTDSCCVEPPAPTMIGGSQLGSTFFTTLNEARFSPPNFISNVADNNSTIPQDRLFINYHFLNDVPVSRDLNANAPDEYRDLSLYEIGLEKTFADGNISAEVIIPFSYQPDTTYNGAPDAGYPRVASEEIELQNIAFGLKALLAETETAAYSVGVRLEAPTADPIRNVPGTFDITIDNEAWAVTPYAAVLLTPTDNLFLQGFASYRMQTTGNQLTSTAIIFANEKVREPAYLNLDAQLGYWLYRNHGGSGITGLQSSLELHYTASDEPYQTTLANAVFNAPGGGVDMLNLTAGLTALLNDKTTVTAGMVLPLTIPNTVTSSFPTDRFMDWSLMLQVNHYFGK